MGRETWNEIVAEVELALLELRVYGGAVWQWLRDSFLLPGDTLVAVVSKHVPAIAGNPALDLAAHGETYAVIFSAVVWLCVLLAIFRCLRFAGRALAGCYYTARRAAAWAAHIPRSLRLRLAVPVQALRRRRPAGRCYSEEFSINALQMAVMIAQRRLPPGHVATAVDIAAVLRLRPGPVEQALESLKKLHLVQVAFGTSEGYAGYMLTRPGEIFLATCKRTTRRAAETAGPIRIPRPGRVPAGPGVARPT